MQKHVTIGVAGHVDHGKTSLVRTLTGIDTDRLEEEENRAVHLSIESGVALFDGSSGFRRRGAACMRNLKDTKRLREFWNNEGRRRSNTGEAHGSSVLGHEIKTGAPGVTRTRGTQIRNLVLYPPELRGQWSKFNVLQGVRLSGKGHL
jgi:hypothetical protein